MKTMVEVRSSLISYIKAIQALLSFDANFPLEVRELTWQGDKFSYPCVRVGQVVLTPMNETCSAHKVEGSVMCFSELPSSLQADQMADIVFQALHGKSFSHGSVKFAGMKCQQLEAVRVEESSVWQSTIKFQVTAS